MTSSNLLSDFENMKKKPHEIHNFFERVFVKVFVHKEN